ncbi:hypothetical protein GCM10010168_67360 [Actinoplanes ianthinogenes]|uniref:Gram-positive cocci surface proteins LPxTG domain-containing protein n=1 Tax=Actinoplanes ianthinogenes TaxID=122358 RepID=A0ABM7LXK3_9ACTN|nr:hypothetical protein [Actinoplanes ianthinogenes]BCJ43933.1 hypothetical protein Aiant_45900 [Actinoplanes ianthinogenes]GGR39255.1 hypothetical protein GCM10010168_67360 [Actinoplanes ianthinogenes]
MTPARSLAAGVAALGFASTLTLPLPAFAAPESCARPQRYAAQSEAELLRVERLDLRGAVAKREHVERPSVTPSPTEDAGEVLEELDPDESDSDDSDDAEFAPAAFRTDDTEDVIAGVGLGDSRTVMIADAPVKSAAAGLILDGRVAGAPAAEQVLRQAPPSRPDPIEQHVGPKRFGPIQVGGGAMAAHARWDAAFGCGTGSGTIAQSSTQLSQVRLGGDLVRVPDKSSTLSSSGLDGHSGGGRSVASATVTAGRIEIAGGEVSIRILRAPTLRVGMSATGAGEVRFQPAVVEVSGPGVSGTRLETSSDRIDVTVDDLGPVTESSPSPVLPSRRSPLPSIPGLPVPSSGGSGGGAPMPESAPSGKSVVRVALGDVRQASKGHALAARATAVKVSVLRAGEGRGKPGYGPVAELGIGVLAAAAVAPETAGHAVEAGRQPAATTLPVTGPSLAPMVITGAGLLVGGVCAFLLGSRRRRPRA